MRGLWAVLAGLLLGVAAGRADVILLQNGARITPFPGQYGDFYYYYGCQDAQIDPAQPLANFGRRQQQGLRGGTDRKLLIWFRNLHRALGPGKQIADAYLVLHVAGQQWALGNQVKVYRLLRYWRQGSRDVEPQPQHWACSWEYRLYSDDSDEARAWAVPGAGRPGVDRAAVETVTADTGLGYDPQAGTWRLDGLGADVGLFYENQAGNLGWLLEYADPQAARGTNLFHSSESTTLELRPELVISCTDAAPRPRDCDLSVAYISRRPQYYRYDPTGSAYEQRWFHNEYIGVLKYPGYAATQKWPHNGELVTFAARVQNVGLSQPSGPFSYRWLLNGRVLSSGQEPVGLPPGGAADYELEWVWDANDYADDSDPHRNSADHRDRRLTFEVDYDKRVLEQCENNNCLSDFLEAPALGIYIEQSFYDRFNQRLNAVGSYSFEDWMQWHVRIWNDVYLEMSRFQGFAEDGALERVRLQKIQVVPDHTLAGGNHVPGGMTDFLLDGEWGFETGANDDSYSDHFAAIIETGLLHECSHQLGVMDMYVMNMEAGTPHHPLKVQVRDGGEYYITRGYYPAYGGLMAGGDTRYSPDYEPTGLYAGHTVGGLNANCGYRRGFYGEYLYDLPQTVRIRARDASGAPLANAGIRIWQSSAGVIRDAYSWQPILDASTDSAGWLTLPDVSTLEPEPFTTLTGHTLHDNPWGRIGVVGVNGVLLIKLDAYGQQDFQWLLLPPVNRAFWCGQTAQATFDIRAEIAPDFHIIPLNVAEGATATSNVGGNPALAVDGDINTRWDPGNVPAGAYLQLDFGRQYDVAQVILYQNNWAADFFEQFRIETSLSGQFAGEQRLFVREPLSWTRAISDRRDIDPGNEQCMWVTYAGFPYSARWLRITCEQAHWTKLAELIVHVAGPERTPPAQVGDLTVVARDPGQGTALLRWTAPGDDGWAGLAERYDIRYSTSPLNARNFDRARQVADPPLPLTGGLPQEFLLQGLLPPVRYWLALKTADNCDNLSAISNVVTFVLRAPDERGSETRLPPAEVRPLPPP